MALNVGRPKHRYTVQEKRAACTAYVMTGSSLKAAEETGIERRTIQRWMKKPWWDAWEEEITEHVGRMLVNKMRGVAQKSYDQLFERLENGDVHVTSAGEIVRHPVKAKDLSMIANIASDKIRLAEGKATSRTETVSLDQNAADFKQLASKYINEVKPLGGQRPIIDGEIVKPALPGDKTV
jgi:hypothetical protein